MKFAVITTTALAALFSVRQASAADGKALFDKKPASASAKRKSRAGWNKSRLADNRKEIGAHAHFGRGIGAGVWGMPRPVGLRLNWQRDKQQTLERGVMIMNDKARVEGCSSLMRTSMQLVMAAIVVLAMSINPDRALAQSGEQSGKEVVAATCSTCHGTGAHGAPRIGNKKAWSKLASHGLTGLTQVALKGIRQMPSHGGNPALTDTEIERAITYMVNQSGGHWVESTSKTRPAAERSGEQVVQAQCVKCHQTGVGGAPKIGDMEAWIPRLKNGLDATVRSAINGHGGMPARGGLANLSDAEMRSAIVYMFNKASVPTKGK